MKIYDEITKAMNASRECLIALAPKQGELSGSFDEMINHPSHYNNISGIECIDVVEHFNFNIGNAIKYLWRAGRKNSTVEDLQKAIWYCQREILRIESENTQ